jgi:hypothetical protein
MKVIPITSAPVLEHPDVLKGRTPPLGPTRWRYYREIDSNRERQLPRLRGLRGAHTGRRAFILGNAPSVGQMDLSKLKGEVTVAVNSAFRLFPKMGFVPGYSCVSDRVRWSEMGRDLLAASSGSQVFYCDDWEVPTPTTLFRADELEQVLLLDRLLWLPAWLSRLAFLRNRAGLFTYSSTFARRFSWDLERGVCVGNSVIFLATQVAAYLGCNPIILIGVEMDYSQAAKHFHDQRVWTPPMSYERDAKPWFELFYREMQARGVAWLNATIGGKVDVLPRVAYDSLF